MKLFTKEIDKKLFEQYSIGSDLENQVVVAKIFNPYGRGTWYLLNSDPEDPEYLWAIVDLGDIEVGSVNRSDLENIKIKPFMLGLERDLSFRPVNALELYKGVNQGKHYAKGGGVDDNEVKFIEYKDKEIMYEPTYNKYYANDEEFDSLEDAKNHIDGGSPLSQKTINAYRHGSFKNGGAIYKHKHMDATAKILEKTNKGYKVEFTDNSVRKPKTKIMYFNDIDFDKDKGYFEKMANGGNTGGTSDSAEMNAPTLGGTMTSSMATGGVSKKEFIAKKVGKVMKEFKDGDLHIGTSNKIVKNPKQAIAIGLSEGKRGWKHRGK
jgi:hypothetical protein